MQNFILLYRYYCKYIVSILVSDSEFVTASIISSNIALRFPSIGVLYLEKVNTALNDELSNLLQSREENLQSLAHLWGRKYSDLILHFSGKFLAKKSWLFKAYSHLSACQTVRRSRCMLSWF